MKAWVEAHQVLASLAAAALAFAVWEAYDAFIVLFAGYLLAAALRPVVDALDRLLPRALAIVATYLALFAALAGVSLGIALPLSTQAGQFGAQLSRDLQPGGQLAFLSSLQLNAETFLSYFEHNATTIATSAIGAITMAIAAIVVSIYILYDWHDVHGSLKGSSFWRALAEALTEAEAALGSWVHGQLLLSACVGGLVVIAMFALGVPFAPVLGALAALTEFIPYVGPILSAAPAVLIGLNGSLEQAVVIALVYLAIHQIENHLLVPIIMRKSVNLHPALVIAVMFAGFELLGLAGVVLAVPFTAFVRIVVPKLWYA